MLENSFKQNRLNGIIPKLAEHLEFMRRVRTLGPVITGSKQSKNTQCTYKN